MNLTKPTVITLLVAGGLVLSLGATGYPAVLGPNEAKLPCCAWLSNATGIR